MRKKKDVTSELLFENLDSRAVFHFENENLENAVRILLNKTDAMFYFDEIERIEEININGSSVIYRHTAYNFMPFVRNGIGQLSDLKYFSGLKSLALEGAGIRNLNFLEGLDLRTLNLQQNEIENITWVGTLKNLKILDLSNNKISNINPLRHLTKLQALWLYNNNISDLSPTSGLESLQISDFSGNLNI